MSIPNPQPTPYHEINVALHHILAKMQATLTPIGSSKRGSNPLQCSGAVGLYSLEHGTAASKPVAARWCQQTLDPQWRALIEWASTTPYPAHTDQLTVMLDFIQFTLAHRS